MGFIVRLTELNDYDTPAWILQESGIGCISQKCAATSHKQTDLSALSTLTSVNLADLECLRYPVDKQSGSTLRRQFYGLVVYQYLIRQKYPKICSQCLSESAYIRKIWEFALVTACPIHRCLLLDICPSCGKRITWSRNKVAICLCKYDWRGYSSPKISDSDLQVTRQIHLLCHLPVNNADSELCGLDESNPLYKTDLQYFVAALLFVASQFAYTDYKKGKKLIDTTGKNFARTKLNTEIHALLFKAWSVFNDWPDNYFQFLEWRRVHLPNQRFKSGLDRDFAEYKSALYYILTSEQLDFMRAAFEEYLVTRWDGGCVGQLRRIGRDRRAISKYVSRKDAKEFLHIKVEGVNRLIASGKLKTLVRSKGGSRTILIERASLESAKHELERRLFLKQIAGMLGVTNQRVYELIDCNLLRPIKGEAIDERCQQMFIPKDVDCLLTALRGKLIKTPITGGANIDFLKALRKLGRVNIGIGQFIQNILDGTIRVVKVSTEPGLASLIFSKSEIKGYIKELDRIRLGETCSVPEVAKRLRIGVTSTRFLITKGIIQIRRQAVKGHYDLRISESAIDLFNSNYVLPAKLAQQFNTTSARLTNLLINHGVNPISGPKVDGGKQYVFKSTEIEQFDLEAIWRASESKHISRLNERKLIDARDAAKILDIDKGNVLDLAERGILKPHRHVLSNRHKADGPFFSMFTIEKYKARTVDYCGLVSSTVAAQLLGVSVAVLYRYISKKLLQVALDGDKGRRYFRLDDVKRLIEDRNNLNQQYVTTAEVASLCKVKEGSVHAWIEAGLLQPISGPRADGLVHNLYLRSDVEKLYAEREAFKAKRVSEGRSSRFSRPAGPNWQPVRNKVEPRIKQLVMTWSAKLEGQPISGQRLLRQLVKEGYRVGINTVYVCLRELR